MHWGELGVVRSYCQTKGDQNQMKKNPALEREMGFLSCLAVAPWLRGATVEQICLLLKQKRVNWIEGGKQESKLISIKLYATSFGPRNNPSLLYYMSILYLSNSLRSDTHIINTKH